MKLLSRAKTTLMAWANYFASFIQQASQGTRSTILNPLAWFFGLCVFGLIGSVKYAATFWIQILLASFAAMSGLLYLGAYVFCLATNQPELLRTEKFLIQQLAIEKGFRGDSTTGPITLPSGSVSQLAIQPVQNQQVETAQQ